MSSKTKIVDDVAAEVVKRGFRGCVLGQRGMFLDREKLKRSAEDFNLAEFIEQQKALSEFLKEHGDLKF